MAKSKRKWIDDAIKHPGALRATAARAGALTPSGKIDVDWLEQQAQEGNTKTARRARLALTLRRMRKSTAKKKGKGR